MKTLLTRLPVGIRKFFGIRETKPSTATAGDLFAFLKKREIDPLRSVWVWSAITARANAVAAAKFGLYRVQADGERELVEKHELLESLAAPNQMMTTRELFAGLSLHLDIFGKAFWMLPVRKRRSRKLGDFAAQSIIPLDPENVGIGYADPKKMFAADWDGQLVTGYSANVDGQTYTLDPEQVVYFNNVHPKNPFDGVSPLTPLSNVVSMGERAVDFNQGFFESGAMPGAIVKTDSIMSSEQQEAFAEQWRRNFSNIDRPGSVLFTEEGASIELPQNGARDVDFKNLLEYARDAALGGYQVPKSLLGMVADANRANAEASEYIFAKYAVLPILRTIESYINAQLLPKMGGDGLVFAFDSPIREDAEQRDKTRESLFRMGALTPNEARAEDGRDALEGGDEAFVAGVVPLRQPEPAAEPKPDDGKKTLLKNQLSPQQQREGYELRFGIAEEKIAREMRVIFRKQEAEVLESLQKGFGKDVASAELSQKWDETLEAFGAAAFLALAVKEGDAMFAEVGASGFAATEPMFRQRISTQASKFASDVNHTTRDRIARAIRQGVEAGEGEREIAGRVRNVFGNAGKVRSRAIARTEVLRASNSARLSALSQLGFEKKQWVTAGDARVRHSHAVLNRKTVGLYSPFIVGSQQMQLPGDSSASAENVVNCRCHVVGAV